MFQRITIQLEGPVCNCDEQKLAWNVGREMTTKDGKAYDSAFMDISCQTCGTRLHVPRDKFVASFELKRAYPGKKAEPVAPPKTKLGVIDGGKLLQFNNGEPDAKD